MLYDEGQERFWQPGRGNKVRGKLVPITMDTPIYREQDVVNYIATLNGRLLLATAYELVAYASAKRSPRWSGRKTVMAFGSKVEDTTVPMLEYVGGSGRFLTFGAPNRGYWKNDRSILCVRS